MVVAVVRVRMAAATGRGHMAIMAPVEGAFAKIALAAHGEAGDQFARCLIALTFRTFALVGVCTRGDLFEFMPAAVAVVLKKRHR